MRIISWNVNGVRAVLKKDLQGFLERQQPSIFCMQETKIAQDLIAELPSFWPGDARWFSAQRSGYSGVATLSAEVPESSTSGFGHEEFDSEGRVLVTDHEDFLLYNIYFPNGGMNEERCRYKERFNDALFEHLQEQLDDGHSIIVLGDYNIAHAEIDIYDPKSHEDESGFLPSEREWMSEFLELGFVDTFRYFHPEEEDRYTWWSYKTRGRMTNRGWRIDYVCVSEDLIERVTRAEILSDVEGSDHCPVLIELE